MSTELNKAKFDPIPVLPPGIAPPLPSESKLAASSPKSPPPNVKPANPKPTPSAVPNWLKGVFAPTKNKGVATVAVCSLLAGWYGVRTIFPPAQKIETVAEVQKEELPSTPLGASPLATMPTVPSATDIVPIPVLPFPATLPITVSPPSVVAIPEMPRIDPGAFAAFSATVPIVNVQQIDPNVVQARFVQREREFVLNTANATLSRMRPDHLQKAGVSGTAVASESSALTPVHFQYTVQVPPVEPPSSSVAIVPVAGSGAISPPSVTLPVMPLLTRPGLEKKIDPSPLAVPVITAPAIGEIPSPVIAVPAIPPATAASTAIVPVMPPTTTPGGPALLVPDLNPTKPPLVTAPIPSVPVYTPPAANIRPGPILLSVGSTGTTEEVKTDFDVDLHYPKSGETYASIAKQHYGDERYGNVLAQFNQSANGGNSRVVQVPPTWWVKKQLGAPAGRPVSAPTPSASRDEWTPASATTAGTYRFYTIPTTTSGGMTFKEIARQAYGSELDWQRVFDLNSSYSADAVLPAGAKIRLTGDAKVGQ